MGRRVKNNVLSARWDKFLGDIRYFFPAKCDGHLLHGMLSMKRYTQHHVFDPSFIEELEARGYDITTLRFSVEKKDDT